MGLPGGSVVKNSPANAEDTGSNPGLGKSHVSGQLSPRATTTEAHAPRAHAPQEKSLQWEAQALQPTTAPKEKAATQESLHTATKTQQSCERFLKLQGHMVTMIPQVKNLSKKTEINKRRTKWTFCPLERKNSQQLIQGRRKRIREHKESSIESIQSEELKN